MIYIIASNVGLSLMMIIVYGRYSRLKITSSKEVGELRKKIDKIAEEEQVVENKFLQLTKDDGIKVEGLLREIYELRKDKEVDIKLKLELQKQLEIALQKVEDTQKRMEDWKMIQDGVMKDSKEAILRVGNDLYKKLSESHKLEAETNKNMIGRVIKSFSENIEKLTSKSPKNDPEKEFAASENHAIKIELPAAKSNVEDPAKKILLDLVMTMKASGHMVNRDYFVPTNFDEEKARMLLCEMVFLHNNAIYIFDFKGCHYLAEYDHLKSENKAAAEEALKQKLDKYIDYLKNPKYRESILKVMSSTKAKFDKVIIVLAIPSKVELQIVKEIRYYEKAREAELEVFDIDVINNLFL